LSEAAELRPPLAMPAQGAESITSTVWIERPSRRSMLGREVPFFVLASAVVAAAFLLPTLKSHHMWLNIPCVFHAATGLPCLACGLTRSYVFTAHGNLYSAFNMHLLGPLLFIGTVGMAVYLGSSVVFGYRIRYRLSRRSRRIAFWSVLGIFLICWAIKLLFMKGSW
jgi:hypothetical protein